MAADNATARLLHFAEASTKDFLEYPRVAIFGKTHDGQRGDWPASHGIDVAQRIGCRDFPENLRVIDDGSEEINGLHYREIVLDQVHPCVVVGLETHQNFRINLP